MRLVCLEIGCSRCPGVCVEYTPAWDKPDNLALRRKVVAADVPPSARQTQPAIEHEKTAGSEAGRYGKIGDSAL